MLGGRCIGGNPFVESYGRPGRGRPISIEGVMPSFTTSGTSDRIDRYLAGFPTARRITGHFVDSLAYLVGDELALIRHGKARSAIDKIILL